MSIFVNRAASCLRHCLSRLAQISSSGRFSTSHTSLLRANVARKLLYQTPSKNNFNLRNTENITSKKSSFSQLVARIGAAIGTLMASCSFKTAQAASSEDLEAIARKQGVLWECIGRQPDESGGYIYQYKLRKEFDYVTLEKRGGYDQTPDKNGNDELERVEEASFQKFLEMYPAIEFEANIAEVEVPKISQDLGYMKKVNRKGIYISLPDQEALEARYEKMRKMNPELKPLQIFSGEGIADDLTYIEAFLKYDVPLSEFVHDHMFHVIPTMNLMLSCPEYSVEKERLRGIVSTFYHRILMAEKVIDEEHLDDLKAHLPKMKTVLGSAVDVFWNFRSIEDFKKIDSDCFDTTFFKYFNEGEGNRAFWKRNFGEELDPVALKDQWKQITSLKRRLP